MAERIVIVIYKTEKEKQFDEIYNAYADDVYKVCLYFTKDKVLAQEAAQRIFLEFYTHFEEVKPELIRAYLIHTAKNFALEQTRKKT